MNWKSVNDDGAPPFDTLVLIYGASMVKGPDNSLMTSNEYALAYNECYPPEMCMTQYIQSAATDKLPIFIGVPFEITHWTKLNEPTPN